MIPFLQTAEIERHVEVLWAQHKLAPRFDVEKLLDDLDLGLLWTPLPRYMGLPVAGQLLPSIRKVLINEELLDLFAATPGLLRFTLAHEIGHWALHAQRIADGGIADPRADGGSLTCPRSDIGLIAGGGDSYRLEFQASLFASHLLAPDRLFVPRVERYGCDGWRSTGQLAREFGMSLSAVVVRLLQDGHAHRDEQGIPRPGPAPSAEQASLRL